MHLLIPFASSSSEGCHQALTQLQLPNLEKLLRRLTPQAPDQGPESSLSPPHERALARALNLPVADGLIPWAALQAQTSLAAPASGSAWAFISPCHWRTGAKHVAMGNVALPDFSPQESKALLAAMQPYFAEDGVGLYYEQPGRWLACGDVFRGLATASLDRVAGRDLAKWLPGSIPLQRLQSEMQMLLYEHPVNDARAARGAPAVNSFWVNGTGALPQLPDPAGTAPKPVLAAGLRAAALSDDWSAWLQAWRELDATECMTMLAALDRGEASQLTLCGERHAQTFIAKPKPVLEKFMAFFGRQRPSTMLEQL